MLWDSFCGPKVCADRAQAMMKAVDAAGDDSRAWMLGVAVQNYDARLHAP